MGDFKSNIYFSFILENLSTEQRSKIRVPVWSGSDESHLPDFRIAAFRGSLVALKRTLILLDQSLTLMTSFNLNYFFPGYSNENPRNLLSPRETGMVSYFH